MSVPDVSVSTRPRTRSYTALPPELKLYFEQAGLRPSWQVEGTLAMMWQEGIEAVTYEGLPPEVKASVDQARMKHNADGLFVQGTVVLCTQSLADYEAAQAEYAAMSIARQQRTDVDELDAAVREQLGLGGIRNPPGILHPAGHGFRPGDFIQHTPASPDK